MERTYNAVLITGPPVSAGCCAFFTHKKPQIVVRRNHTFFNTNNVFQGVGKTTLVRNLCDKLRNTYVCSGFVTEEVRSGQSSARIGFDVVTLDGERTPLAREHAVTNFRMPKVGKYSVYVKDFEDAVLPLLAQPNPRQGLLVIDEIGKMELKSKKFETAVSKLIGSTPILATIPYRPRERLSLVEQLKNSPAAKIFEISKNNRDYVQNDIMKYTENMLKINN